MERLFADPLDVEGNSLALHDREYLNLPAQGLDVPAQGREAVVGCVLEAGELRLGHRSARGDLDLGLAQGLAKPTDVDSLNLRIDARLHARDPRGAHLLLDR